MKLHKTSLMKKWMLNVMSVIFVVLVAVEICVIAVAKNYYYDSIYQVLDTQMENLENYFTEYRTVSNTEFESVARAFAEAYEDKDRFEVQIFDENGNVIVSTSGFSPAGGENISDYQTAIGNADGGYKGSYEGTLLSGEPVMTLCVALGDSCRAVRMLTSLQGARDQLTVINLTTSVVIVILFTLILLMGIFFIRSILRPIRRISAVARTIAQGNFDAYIETTDRGEIGDLCNSINYMATELGTTEHMKNDFISSVSHELRTPLTAIRGWGETIAELPDDPATVQKGATVILSESERLSGLVENLLDFSRMQNGALSVHPVPCDLNALVREAMLAFDKACEKAGLSMTFKERKLPSVPCDRNRIKQVLANIIDNAIKNTPAGGRIVVSTKMQNEFAEMIVSDNGKGIPLKDLGRIKQKFYKAETNQTVRGSGIGLAVADEIVTKHGGALTINSVENIGTTVTVSLPVKPGQGEQA